MQHTSGLVKPYATYQWTSMQHTSGLVCNIPAAHSVGVGDRDRDAARWGWGRGARHGVSPHRTLSG
eukprot:scaffold7615_cov66-Phaeocystis_antarctica.AAC.3